MKTTIQKAKALLKSFFLTKEGWIAWIIANIVTSLPWFLPLAYGFLFNDRRGYTAAAAVYAFILLPFTPFWLLNVAIAYFVLKIFNRNKKPVRQ